MISVNFQNIDFQATILSRFDMIFIVKDAHDERRDKVADSKFNYNDIDVSIVTDIINNLFIYGYIGYSQTCDDGSYE